MLKKFFEIYALKAGVDEPNRPHRKYTSSFDEYFETLEEALSAAERQYKLGRSDGNYTLARFAFGINTTYLLTGLWKVSVCKDGRNLEVKLTRVQGIQGKGESKSGLSMGSGDSAAPQENVASCEYSGD